MHFTSETTSDAVTERQFTLDDVPGVFWTPAGASHGGRPLILLGHGGGQHKKEQGIAARARRFVTECGFDAVAIDAPGHGDRPASEQYDRLRGAIRDAAEAGEPRHPHMVRFNEFLAGHAVPEWRAALDALLDGAGGPAGYWGVSLGTAIGVPLVAAEPRITAAVFGLYGHEGLAEAASQIKIPVEFLVQWEDELMPRDSALALFDAFGSADKTLHANPGGHTEVPRREIDSAQLFFTRNLAGPAGSD